MANWKADIVCSERDGSAPSVLGADGFWASKGGDGWSDDRTAGDLLGIDPDRILVTEHEFATTLSREARAAIWVRRIFADAVRNAQP